MKVAPQGRQQGWGGDHCCFSSSPLPGSWVLPCGAGGGPSAAPAGPGSPFPNPQSISFPTSKPVCAVPHPVLLWVLPPRIPFALILVGLGGSKSNYKASPLGSGSRSMCDTGCGQTAQLPSRQHRHLQHTKGPLASTGALLTEGRASHPAQDCSRRRAQPCLGWQDWTVP